MEPRPPATATPPLDRAAAVLWWQKWRWYQRSRLPWNVARLHVELARRQAFARGTVHGNALQMLLEGRLELGPQVHLEPGVWLTSDTGRISIGTGSLLNLDVMIAAVERVEIGAHCMLANGCVVTDGNHRFDDPDRPVPWQGFTTTRADGARRQRLAGRPRRRHQRRDDRPACGDRRELGGHHRHPGLRGRRRRAATVLRTAEPD